jgi:hypothetical protein
MIHAAVAQNRGQLRRMVRGHLEARPDSKPLALIIDLADRRGRRIWEHLRREEPGDWVGPGDDDDDENLDCVRIAVVDGRDATGLIPTALLATTGDGVAVVLVMDGAIEVGRFPLGRGPEEGADDL